ncbi:MAG: undecaprenyl-phosphate glucose phosphotransferase [Bacteroidota bacterium]|nr:undecaprenyl-phosphate glucose phosphotransferase [Bacteroidota bacterium]
MLNAIVIISKALFNDRIPDAVIPVYFHYLIFLNVSWIVFAWLSRVYSENSIYSFEAFSRQTKHLYISWLCSIMIYLFFFRVTEISRTFIFFSLLIFGFSLLLNRLAYLGVREFFKESHHFTKRVLILGYNNVAKELAGKLERTINNTIVGFIEDPLNVKELSNYPIVGTLKETMEISQQLRINQIFSTLSPEQNIDIYELMQQAESKFINFRIIPDLSFFIKKNIYVEFFENMPMISLRGAPLEDIGNRIKKRMMDVIISLFALVFILSWLIPLIGLLIYLESPGPIFFSQLRSGKNNKSFRCLKFRSMKVNNDADRVQATKNDNRFTKIGKLIRKSSLDEFPQFINVLKGEMSIIGPRPHMLKHTEHYSKIVQQYMVRQFLKPGISGWAQVNGYRGEIHGNEQIIGRVECDIWYSENWSLWLDIRIMFLTVLGIFKGEKNAY